MKQRITIDHRTNKQVRHYDSDGDYMRLSVDETIARGLNAWKGWSCSAGVRGLYIDYDGNVWVCNTASAVNDRYNVEIFNSMVAELRSDGSVPPEEHAAEVNKIRQAFRKTDASVRRLFEPGSRAGLLGNIYNGFKLPSSWFSCQWSQCGCGADVFLPKADPEHLDKLLVMADQTDDSLVDEVEAVVAAEPNFAIPHQVLWDLGRRCNYDCSYCWPSAHNRDAQHKPLAILQQTVDRVISEWGHVRWNFGGGEPTLHPNFLEFLSYLKQHNQWVLVTSNGSRPRSYWREAIHLINSVNLSVHFEFINESKLLANIEEICQYFDEHPGDHWLEIKLMSPPQFVERALSLKQTILRNDLLRRNNGIVSIVPIRGADGHSLVDYSEDQLALLQKQ